jgi:hypothetical protein
MLGDHLEEMARSSVRLVMVTVVMIAVITSGFVKLALGNESMNVVNVSFREEMELDVTDVEGKQKCRQHT